MDHQPRNHPRPGSRTTSLAAAFAAVAILVAACSSGATAAPSAASTSRPSVAPAASSTASTSASSTTGSATQSTTPAASGTPGPRTRLVVGLGYIPSVQFAQFYYADQAGYYAAAGLDIEFQNKIDPELIALVGQGAVDIGIADGTSVIPAVSQEIPIKYLMTIYAQFPNVVVALDSSHITSAADLKGKRVGIPGKYGSSWIHLQALLAGANLTTGDVDLVLFPDFGQVAALEKGAVDAAAGYLNNEPIRLAESGATPVSLALPADQQLPGPGLIAGTTALATKHDAILAFAVATRRAMQEIAADPAKGVDASIARIPELASQRDTQLAILKATAAIWQSDYTVANGSGAVDPALWEHSIAFIGSLPDKLLARTVTAADCIDPTFLPAP